MARRSSSDEQLSLFGGPAVPEAGLGWRGGVRPAEAPPETAELGARLPRGLYLGGSTWSFPGWAGLVYDTGHSEAKLARAGLAAYAHHPIFRAVGIDRTFYRPLPPEDFARYAEDVPDDFRFLVKAHEALTLPSFPDLPRYGAERGGPNFRFLDAAYAAEAVVAPFVEGLGGKAGALLFQFGPQDLGTPPDFAARLHRFLSRLPRGPIYAVELRQRQLLVPDYAAALADAGACHCLNVHPRMPGVRTQAELTGAAAGRVMIARWLLGKGASYEEAGRRFAPFNQLAEPDEESRGALAELARGALAEGQPFLATINNNAEGCAPLSAVLLAREIVEGGSAGD
jgi:uncharacterized protein YecE (DUF72 family)